jgi:hypothetical protein
MKAPYAIRKAEPRDGYVLLVTFADGTSREVDFLPFLRAPRDQAMLDSLEVFRSFEIDDDSGTIVWPNGRDIAPDMLHAGLRPAWMEDEADNLAKKRAV